MIGTFRSTGGFTQTTSPGSAIRIRLAGFAVAIAGVALLIIAIDRNLWRQLARLQEQFAEVRAERFYFGIQFRLNLRTVREDLVDLQLSNAAVDRQRFRSEAGELKAWLLAKTKNLATPEERADCQRLTMAYNEFLTHIESLVQAQDSKPRNGSFAQSYEDVRRASQPLLTLCDGMVRVERGGFMAFLSDSDTALISLQRLLVLSLLLLIALAAALVALVYRGMIALLRAELNESRAIIERQEKLASLGVLGAGVAHEIRNPLTAIKFRLFSLKKSLPRDAAGNEDVHVISDEINRLDRIVKDFLRFARPSEPQLVRVPAERILQEVHALLRDQLEKNAIKLTLQITEVAWIQADTEQIKQVLINLIQNAADSIGSRGAVTLGLTRTTANFGPGSHGAALLSVSDTGKGISPEVQKRLFDPFFTTKESGTGLGLAIAARIVEKHGGLLRYKTELNRGTTFKIVLPRIDNNAP